MKQEIKKKIVELADPKYKEFHSGLCPNTNNIIGVRIPILRSYAKELIKQDWRKVLQEIDDTYYEEIMLQGMIIGLAKMELEKRLEYLEKFIPKIDNWAVCDITCGGLKFTKKNQAEVFEFLQKYLQSSKEFEIRFGVVMLLNYYVTEEYRDKILKIIEEIKQEGYYVKMAVAWLISMLYIKFPKKTMTYLNHNTLDRFTYNKALQKIIESERVPKEEKEKIKKMKIK